jgi:hypothetical protein
MASIGTRDGWDSGATSFRARRSRSSTFPFDGQLVKLRETNFLKVAERYKVKAYGIVI